MLAAAVHKQATGGRLDVLDVMCGAGGRGARYLQQAGADSVWSNDLDSRNHASIVTNAQSALDKAASRSVAFPYLRTPVTEIAERPASSAGAAPDSLSDQSPSALFYAPEVLPPSAIQPATDANTLFATTAPQTRRSIVSHVEGALQCHLTVSNISFKGHRSTHTYPGRVYRQAPIDSVLHGGDVV